MPHLNDFPNLKEWFVKNQDLSPSFSEDPLNHTIYQFCLALTLSPADSSRLWQTALTNLMEKSENILTDFQEIEKFFNYSGVSLHDLIATWGHEAFAQGREDEFFILMEQLAFKTESVNFYFLAAWSAFNQDDYESCLTLCEQVDSFYAPVLTLRGQALLESGKVEESIAVLKEVVVTCSTEVLAWFQLAKSYWVLRRHQSAFDALENCRQIVGRNHEVSLFMAIVAIEAPYCQAMHEKAWGAMMPFLLDYRANAEYMNKLISLAIRADRRDWMEKITREADWENLGQAFCPSKNFGEIMRSLHEKSWHDLARQILDRLIESQAR